MYLPSHFTEQDSKEIERLLYSYPLATVITQSSEGLKADHLPVLRGGEGRLIGHVARDNGIHLNSFPSVLVIFKGEDSYISANWYPSKKIHHKQVPTWNYSAVHFHGTIDFSHDKKVKMAIVGKLTKHFENKINGNKAWRIAEAPKDFIDDRLDKIVAFEIKIERMEAKVKLSQNKEMTDRQGVISQLDRQGKTQMFARMRALEEDSL